MQISHIREFTAKSSRFNLYYKDPPKDPVKDLVKDPVQDLLQDDLLSGSFSLASYLSGKGGHSPDYAF